MSLDLYVISKHTVKHHGTGVFTRENGETKELSVEECNKLYPNSDIKEFETEDNILWDGNITHNMTKMASKCICECPNKVSLYQLLWHPEECTLLSENNTLNSSYIKAVSICLEDLKNHKDFYEQYNPENHWGNYNILVIFTEEFLKALNSIPQDKYSEYSIKASI